MLVRSLSTLLLFLVMALFAGCETSDAVTSVNEVKPAVERSISRRTVSGYETGTIELIGSSKMVLNVGDTYTEPGFVALSADGIYVTSLVNVTTDINTDIPNIWRVVYTFTDLDETVVSTHREVTVLAETDTATYVEWESTQPWYTYTIGDRRIRNSSLYECVTVEYSYLDPALPSGSFGWILIREL